MKKKKKKDLPIVLVISGITLIVVIYLVIFNTLSDISNCPANAYQNCTNIPFDNLTIKVAPYAIVLGLVIAMTGILLMFSHVSDAHTKHKS